MQPQHKELPEVFLFINSGSGGGIGKELVGLNKTDKFTFNVPVSQFPSDKNKLVPINLHLYDMKNTEKRNAGFEYLKSFVQQEKRVIMVICGGDGTVMWVVSEMHNHDIEHMKVPIAMLPLGTGNDFSRVLGWGPECPSDLLENDYAKLKKRISYWMSAIEENLDIWMVDADVQEYGKFQKVDNHETKVQEGKTLSKHFCNYFSVGIDGKVGYSFDLHRTKSRIGNLIVYGGMGIAKSFTKTKTLGELTKDFRQNYLQIQIKSSKIVPESARDLANNSEVILQRGSTYLQEIKQNENLLFLNINSFMAGVKDIWKNAKHPETRKDAKFGNQSHSDGKIEVMSFGGVMSLGLEKQFGGFSTKIFQGSGPFSFEFNAFPREQKHRTYLQIDGQFIRYTHPKSFVVQKSSLSKTGKIRILRRLPLEVQRGCCC